MRTRFAPAAETVKRATKTVASAESVRHKPGRLMKSRVYGSRGGGVNTWARWNHTLGRDAGAPAAAAPAAAPAAPTEDPAQAQRPAGTAEPPTASELEGSPSLLEGC